MTKTIILTPQQNDFLKFFAADKNLSDKFYLTGGTALSAFYIPYRYSEDLDFFSQNEFKVQSITVFIRSIKQKLEFKNFDFNSSFNRNLFFINFADSQLKIEFTYFPFPQVEKPKTINGVKIDSIADIAVNKIFTIYQDPRARDFIDTYIICKKYNFPLDDLIKKAKVKFDWHIDPLKLGSQFLLSKDLKDYPKLIEKVNLKEVQKFFETQAKKLGKQIFK